MDPNCPSVAVASQYLWQQFLFEIASACTFQQALFFELIPTPGGPSGVGEHRALWPAR